jgi:hypothetical protein
LKVASIYYFLARVIDTLKADWLWIEAGENFDKAKALGSVCPEMRNFYQDRGGGKKLPQAYI